MRLAVPSRARRLLRNWLAQGVTWYALTEVVARLILEGGFVLALLVLGVSPAIVVVAWIAFHTAAWVFFYGGFMILWKVVLRAETEMPRLEAYLDDLKTRFVRTPFLRLVLLRGSAARGDLGVHSDIDVLGVPERGLRAKARAIAFWWGLRAGAALRRVPLEARWVDSERLVPYHVLNEVPIVLKPASSSSKPADRLASRGILVCFSGIDGSGKTTVAHHLVTALRNRGLNAEYFYGHRPAYLREGTQVSFAIGFKSFWRRVGGSLADLERHRGAKAVLDLCTFLDYPFVQLKLSRLLRPNTIVISDRYVADVIAYLRFLGPGLKSIEGLLVRISAEPDIAFFFDLDPREALKRKREQTLQELEKYSQAYSDLRPLLGFVSVDASKTEAEVRRSVERILEDHLLIPATAQPWPSGRPSETTAVGAGD